MQLATVLTPASDENLQLAAQCGVTHFVTRYPGPELRDVVAVRDRVANYGLQLAVIEGYLPIERIKLGQDDGSEIEAMKNLIRHMGEAGIPILCYNFMSGTDWVRTAVDVPERGGAKVTAFRLDDVAKAMNLAVSHVATIESPERSLSNVSDEPVTHEQLWSNLARMLDALLPVAEDAGVRLAMHPDDPPLPQFLGRARIMNSVEAFERLLQWAPSPHNGICFCQGSFASMGVDIVDAIHRLGPAIQYVHFRDVRGHATDFVETFHDNGPSDMAAACRAYREVGFDGPIRPDHVPQLFGEDDGEPGYTMLGRLFAYGYIRGLLQATSS